MQARLSDWLLTIAIVLLGLPVVACDDDLVPIAWSGIRHDTLEGGGQHLEITELLGPEGATIDSFLPGTYVARGTYAVTGFENHDYVRITLSVPDWCFRRRKSHAHIDRLRAGQASGNFEASCKPERGRDAEELISRRRDRGEGQRMHVSLIIEDYSAGPPVPVDVQYLEEVTLYGRALAVVAAVAPVVHGQAVTMAATYSPGGAEPHPVVVLDGDGQPWDWRYSNSRLPAGWYPHSVGEAELVAVLDQGRVRTQVFCSYIGGPNTRKIRRTLNIKLRAAKTGEVIDSTTLIGPWPDCAEYEAVETTETFGRAPSLEEVVAWLRTYVDP
jgi:hypothetical protein